MSTFSLLFVNTNPPEELKLEEYNANVSASG